LEEDEVVQQVWRIAHKTNTEWYTLHPTRAAANAAPGTDRRREWGKPVRITEDVVFICVQDGWAEDGGGSPLSVHHTYRGARTAKHRYEFDVEIWEVQR
jgi:hypothetical protein